MPSRLLDISWMISGMRASRLHAGRGVTALHHVLHAHQPLAELASGV